MKKRGSWNKKILKKLLFFFSLSFLFTVIQNVLHDVGRLRNSGALTRWLHGLKEKDWVNYH